MIYNRHVIENKITVTTEIGKISLETSVKAWQKIY